ncbi:MAG: methyltransferase [Myxococcota bacterium]
MSIRPSQWISEAGDPPPDAVHPIDDRAGAAATLERLKAGETLLWTGQYKNGRHFLKALAKRLAGRPSRGQGSLAQRWRSDRLDRGAQAHILGRLLVQIRPDGSVVSGKAPDTVEAVHWAWGRSDEDRFVGFRTLLGAVSAAAWRRRGVEVPGLEGSIIPHYGVFSPTRTAYVELVNEALDDQPLSVLDMGCGTGVLGFLALQRGAASVVGVDIEPRAVQCALDNAMQLGLADRYAAKEQDLFADLGRFDRVIFNAPWVPEAPRTRLDRSVYDSGGQAVQQWLHQVGAHLTDGGQGWLILSDFPEHLGLRPAGAIEATIAAAGLRVLAHPTRKASHRKVQETTDPLHHARSQEQIHLWILGA